MESMEQEDVEASYLLGFLDDHEGLEEGILVGYDDFDYFDNSQKKDDPVNVNHVLKLNDIKSNKNALVEHAIQKQETLQISTLTDSFCRKERSLNSSPRKRTPCTIGCRSLEDLELMSRRRSLRSQFAITCTDSMQKDHLVCVVEDSCTQETLLQVKEQLNKTKQSKWLPSKSAMAYLLRPVCSQTKRGNICKSGLNHSCTTETLQTILNSASLNLAQKNFISVDGKVSEKTKDISLIRGKFSSAMQLPTYIKSSVQLRQSLTYSIGRYFF